LITPMKSGAGGDAGAAGAFTCGSLMTSDCVLANLRAANKKQVLQELARKAAKLTGQSESAIYEVLNERELLGTTGIGHGIAIPHGKLPGLNRVYGVFAKLERPVDFDAIDNQPVDLIFLLLAPANCGADHLKALAKVSRLLRDRILCEKMRSMSTCDAIYALMNETESRNAA
jgi:PTS system nitrogen regulatory IIA component